jgi:hypothetical protein
MTMTYNIITTLTLLAIANTTHGFQHGRGLNAAETARTDAFTNCFENAKAAAGVS